MIPSLDNSEHLLGAEFPDLPCWCIEEAGHVAFERTDRQTAGRELADHVLEAVLHACDEVCHVAGGTGALAALVDLHAYLEGSRAELESLRVIIQVHLHSRVPQLACRAYFGKDRY